jgi:hypothetical protein
VSAACNFLSRQQPRNSDRLLDLSDNPDPIWEESLIARKDGGSEFVARAPVRADRRTDVAVVINCYFDWSRTRMAGHPAMQIA